MEPQLNTCQHENFAARVNVGRITDIKPMAFVAEVEIQCADCGLPFEFIGIPHGFNYNQPTGNITMELANLPIKPKGQEGHGIGSGYTVKHWSKE